MVRVLALILGLIGVRYAAIGASVLLHLDDVTAEWVRASRDPDFWMDFELFKGSAAILAAMLILFGASTAIAGIGVVAERPWARRPWLGLTIVALILHSVWLFAKIFPGRVTPWTCAGFALVCVAYALVWGLQRPGRIRAESSPLPG